MSSKFEPMVESIRQNLDTVKGELYNFTCGKKKSASIARKHLLNITKLAKELRVELQKSKSALPVRRRNISDETRAKMAEMRKKAAAEKAAKKNRGAKVVKATASK